MTQQTTSSKSPQTTGFPRGSRLRPGQWLTLATTLVVSLLIANPVLSQTVNRNNATSKDTWYQVELIIFRQSGKSTDQIERWRQDIQLSYPLDWQVLTKPEPETTAATSDTATTTTTNALAQQPAAVDPMSLVPDSRKLYLLSQEELLLNDQAKKIQRNNRYRLLFHGGWRQGMVEYGEEPSIIITAGNMQGEHYELEGSINLKLQRYLHITTDLWLTEFAANLDQERRRWPELPRPPYLPRTTTALATTPDSSGGSNYWTQFQVDSPEYDNLLKQPYIIENIAKIEQTRRMRSNELHYIDHPLIGILIQFTPSEAPSEPAAVGAAGGATQGIAAPTNAVTQP